MYFVDIPGGGVYIEYMNNTAAATRTEALPNGKWNAFVRLPEGWMYVGTRRTQAAAERMAASCVR